MSRLATLKGLVAVSNSVAPVLAAGSYNVDFSGGNLFQATLAGDVTLYVCNLKPGHFAALNLTQDAAGGRRVTWGAGGGGIAPAATATITSATPGALALDTAAGALSSFVLQGTAQDCSTAKLVARTPSLPTGDEVFLAPTGSDDTANVLAVLTASKVAVLGPPGARYFLDGRTLAVSQANCGGVRLMARVEVQPVAGWVPAIGLVDDPTNCFFTARGSDGAYSSTSPSIQRRGSRVVVGIVSTAGLSAGMLVELKASPTGGSSLPQQREIVQVASVVDANTITTTNPLRLNYGDAYNTLPVLLRSVTAIESFFIECGEGAFFNTLGRNIAGVGYLERAITVPGTGLAVTTTPPRRIRFDNITYMGFTRAMLSGDCIEGVVVRKPYSAGLNNACTVFTTSHGNLVEGFRSSPAGPYVASTGVTRCAMVSYAGGSDNVFRDNEFLNLAGGIRCLGGFCNAIESSNRSFGLLPDIRFTRDPGLVGAYCGALFDSYLAPTAQEYSDDYKFGDLLCADTATDAVTRPVSAGAGVRSMCFVDFRNITAGKLMTVNDGNGNQALAGSNGNYPCGGPMLFDCFYGGYIEEIYSRNTNGCAVSTFTGGYGGVINQIVHQNRPGISTDSPNQVCLLLGAGGANTAPHVRGIYQGNGGQPLSFDATFAASPDYDLRVDECINQGVSPPFVTRGVVPALNAGPVSYLLGDATALDTTAAAGTRRVVEAAPDQEGPAVLLQNGNSTIVFIGLEGGTALVTGAVTLTDLLTCEGGANHRFKVNNAATMKTVFGRAAKAKAAGNGYVEVRGGI